MIENEENPVMLTVQEVQAILKIGRNKVYEVFARADFPAICLGRRYVVDSEAFEQWCKQRHERKEK